MRPAAPLLAALALMLISAGAAGTPTDTEASRARIAIIIDDLGNDLRQGRRVIRLPGPIACAVLPQTPYATRLAREAHAHGKEVVLHLPMESADGVEPGPGSLDSTMTAAQIAARVDEDLISVPYAIAVSNHMGSLLTQQLAPMTWLMQALAHRRELLFIDSRTTPRTVAAQIAGEIGVRHLARDVFLDSDRDPKAIEYEFDRLIELARTRGRALAVGHPYAETLAVLEQRLPGLGLDVVLVSLSELLRAHRPAEPSVQTARPAPAGTAAATRAP